MSKALTRDAAPEQVSMEATAPGVVITQQTTNEDFEYIREHFGDPRATDRIRPENYYTFQMVASGDGLDSYFTRQHVETSFANFQRDLKKGQALLANHTMESLAFGTSYDGYVMPAEVDRFEYEPTFYPKWDRVDLRTTQWLVGKYFIPRGLTLNGQATDDIIRGLEMGSQRRSSISFLVGQYVCGIDGKDFLAGFFGPEPDAECNHFPGIAYNGDVAFAWMKDNVLLETSIVYKNASPSSMLLRKAQEMAARGMFAAKDVLSVEERLGVRLPRHERTLFASGRVGESTEDDDMVRRGSATAEDAKRRQAVRDAVAAEPVEDEEAASADSATDGGDGDGTAESVAEADVRAEGTEGDDGPESDTEGADADTEGADAGNGADAEAADEDAEGEADEADEAEGNADSGTAGDGDRKPDLEAIAGGKVDEHPGHSHKDETKGGHAPKKPDEGESDDEATVDAEGEAEGEEPTREEAALTAYLSATDALSGLLQRNPEALTDSQLATAARAERSVDLALIDAGCDSTVGSHVARQYDVRSKAVSEALGEPITAEAVRKLRAKAELGDDLYSDLVTQAVQARNRAQGDKYDSEAYRTMLLREANVAFVRSEIESWKETKETKFTPGRAVIPRDPVDVKSSADERQSLPAGKAKPGQATPRHSLLEPRR